MGANYKAKVNETHSLLLVIVPAELWCIQQYWSCTFRLLTGAEGSFFLFLLKRLYCHVSVEYHFSPVKPCMAYHLVKSHLVKTNQISIYKIKCTNDPLTDHWPSNRQIKDTLAMKHIA